MFVDIGVNLTNKAFAADLPEVVANAFSVGVKQMVITGTDIKHSRTAIELTQRYPKQLLSTAGIHPHHATDFDDHALYELADLARAHSEVVAIGECGLDFNRNYSPQAAQTRCFEAQLELACDLQLPVFLHQRDAQATFIETISRYRSRLVGAVVHCFTGDAEELARYKDLDLHIGVTGWICDERRGQALQLSAADIPIHRLMIETDAPYLLPRDLIEKPKSRRNEPKYLPHIGQVIAKLRGVSLSAIAENSSANAKAFFALPTLGDSHGV